MNDNELTDPGCLLIATGTALLIAGLGSMLWRLLW